MTENKTNNENRTEVRERRSTPITYRFFSPFASFFNDGLFDEDEDDFKIASMLRTDYVDEGDNYALEIEVPGVDKKNIKLSVDDGYLTLKATFENRKEDDSRKVLRHEKTFGSFTRNYYVGENIENSDIDASLDNGILTVRFPKKKEKESASEIEIK